jgi:hypothetical protein
MKTVQSLASIGLGLFIAWAILSFVKPVAAPKVSTFTLDPWPLSLDNSNLALIGVGLASRAPAPPSVMDASPASSAKPVMMMAAPAPAMKMMAPAPAMKMMAAPAPAPAPAMMMKAPMPTPAPSS